MTDGKSSEKNERFIVESCKGVILWSWNMMQDICSICKASIVDKCSYCISQEYGPEKDCKIAFGKCGHAFHQHCIEKWISDNRNCVLCNQRWHLDYLK